MPERNPEGLLSEKFSSTSSVSKKDKENFDEVGRDKTWEQFKWKIIEPYIKIINNQTKITRELILISVFIFVPISFSFLHGLGLQLFDITRMNFDLDFVGYVSLGIGFCCCLRVAFSLKK